MYNLFIPTKKPSQFILYNTLTSAAFVVDTDVKNVLEKSIRNDLSQLKSNEIDFFKKSGVLVDDHIDERNIVRVKREDARFHKDYIKFVVLTTYACNLACPYCFEGKGEVHHKAMSEGNVKLFIKFVKNMALEYNRKTIDVTLFGGEPLLNKNACLKILDELFHWCKKNGIKFKPGIITNGTLLTQDIVNRFVKYGVYFIQITLDGPKNIHDKRRIYKDGKGTYEDIIKSLKIVKKSGIPIQLLVNVDKNNWKSIEKLFDDLIDEDLGGIVLPIEPVYNVTDACAGYSSLCFRSEEIKDVIPKLQRLAYEKGFVVPLAPNSFPLWCGTEFRFSFVVDSFCDIYKCVSFLGDKKHRIGSIGKDGMITDVEYPFYDLMSRDPLSFELCRDCKLLPICGGGCSALAFINKGTYHAENCLRIQGLHERLLLYLEDQFPEQFNDGR